MLFQTIQPKIICWDGCGNLTYVCIYSSDKGQYFAQMGKVNLMYVSSIHILPSYPNGCVHLCTPVVAGCKFLELDLGCDSSLSYPYQNLSLQHWRMLLQRGHFASLNDHFWWLAPPSPQIVTIIFRGKATSKALLFAICFIPIVLL